LIRSAKKVIDGVPEVDEAIALCTTIAKHYNKQRLGEFKVCKGELERFINNLTSLPFADFSLESKIPLIQITSTFSTSWL
jgi:hypothetical protein